MSPESKKIRVPTADQVFPRPVGGGVGSSPSLMWICLLLLASALFGSPFQPPSALGATHPQVTKGPLFVELRGDRLTVRVEEVPLQIVLEAIGHLSGVEVVFRGPLEEKITVWFDELPLDEAVKRLLARRSYVLLYAASESREPGPLALSTVSVFEDGRLDGYGPGHGPPTPGRHGTAAHPDSPESAEAMEASTAGSEEQVALDLLGVLEGEGDGPARAAALSGLEGLETVPVARLAAIVLQDWDPAVRRGAVELLGRRAAADPHVRVVVAAATADPDRGVRESAMALLAVLDQSEGRGKR